MRRSMYVIDEKLLKDSIQGQLSLFLVCLEVLGVNVSNERKRVLHLEYWPGYSWLVRRLYDKYLAVKRKIFLRANFILLLNIFTFDTLTRMFFYLLYPLQKYHCSKPSKYVFVSEITLWLEPDFFLHATFSYLELGNNRQVRKQLES